jgi:hypothetical protein
MDFVGVIDPFILELENSLSITPLKRHALVFDRLAVPSLTDWFLKNESVYDPRTLAVMQWLIDKGVLFDVRLEDGIDISNPQVEEEFESSIFHALGLVQVIFGVDLNRIRQAKKGKEPELTDKEIEDIRLKAKQFTKRNKKKLFETINLDEMLEHTKGMTIHQTRAFSIMLRYENGMDSYPILASRIPSTQDSPVAKNEVVQIVLNSLPIPDETTPWEQILDFRNDADSRSKFIDLRNWMSEVARAELKPNEVAEKLEYLMSQYQRHIKLHKMKTNIGTLETIVVTGAEVLGDLVSFRWGKAAEALFSLTKRHVALLEGELTAPGNEVAYIVKANETFNV